MPASAFTVAIRHGEAEQLIAQLRGALQQEDPSLENFIEHASFMKIECTGCEQELRHSGLTPKFVQKCQARTFSRGFLLGFFSPQTKEIQEKGCLQQAEAFRKDGAGHGSFKSDSQPHSLCQKQHSTGHPLLRWHCMDVSSGAIPVEDADVHSLLELTRRVAI